MNTPTDTIPSRKRKELTVFLVLAVLLAPVLAVGIVGSFGFSIWMYQLIAGPPTVSTTASTNH